MIPARLMESLRQYIAHHRPVGSFLGRVLANDLAGAVLAADATSLAALPEIVRWLHNEAPAPCWGSEQAVTKWLANGEARRTFLRSVGTADVPTLGQPAAVAQDLPTPKSGDDAS